MIKDLNSELGFEQSIKELSRRKSILMAFLTPRNLIFSSQNPNSTFHSRSQVKRSDFFFSNFDFSLQEIWFFQLLLKEFEKSSQNQIFLLLRTQISIFHSNKSDFFFSEPEVKIGFFFSNFDFSLQEICFFQLFTLRKRKVKSKPDSSSSKNPNFDFSL